MVTFKINNKRLLTQTNMYFEHCEKVFVKREKNLQINLRHIYFWTKYYQILLLELHVGTNSYLDIQIFNMT